MPVVRTPLAESGLTANFDIEAMAKTGDDSYTGAGKKAAGAEENDEDELDMETEDKPSPEYSEGRSSTGISFFA